MENRKQIEDGDPEDEIYGCLDCDFEGTLDEFGHGEYTVHGIVGDEDVSIQLEGMHCPKCKSSEIVFLGTRQECIDDQNVTNEEIEERWRKHCENKQR